jgi:hypothetical protein
MKALPPSKISEPIHPMAHCHILEELNFNKVAMQNLYSSFGPMEISGLSNMKSDMKVNHMHIYKFCTKHSLSYQFQNKSILPFMLRQDET